MPLNLEIGVKERSINAGFSKQFKLEKLTY